MTQKPRTLSDQIELLENASREALRALSLVLAMNQASRIEQTEEEKQMYGLRSYHVDLDPNAKDQVERAILDLNHAGVSLATGISSAPVEPRAGRLDADGIVKLEGGDAQ